MSIGLRTPAGPRLSTGVEIMVVLMSEFPSSSWTVRLSHAVLDQVGGEGVVEGSAGTDSGARACIRPWILL